MTSAQQKRGNAAEVFFVAGSWGNEATGLLMPPGLAFGNGGFGIRQASGMTNLALHEVLRFSPHPRYNVNGDLRVFELEVQGGMRAVVAIPAASIRDLPLLLPRAALDQRSEADFAERPALDYSDDVLHAKQRRHTNNLVTTFGIAAGLTLGVVSLLVWAMTSVGQSTSQSLSKVVANATAQSAPAYARRSEPFVGCLTSEALEEFLMAPTFNNGDGAGYLLRSGVCRVVKDDSYVVISQDWNRVRIRVAGVALYTTGAAVK